MENHFHEANSIWRIGIFLTITVQIVSIDLSRTIRVLDAEAVREVYYHQAYGCAGALMVTPPEADVISTEPDLHVGRLRRRAALRIFGASYQIGDGNGCRRRNDSEYRQVRPDSR